MVHTKGTHVVDTIIKNTKVEVEEEDISVTSRQLL